ncbi:MAG: hypothetical protein AB1632_04850 [Nitrospirota bacterium]
MGISKILRSLSTPYGIVFYTVLLSFLAWIMPDFGILRKGFSRQFSMGSFGFFLAMVWYASAIVCAFLFYSLALKAKLSPALFDRYASFDRKGPYVLLSMFAFIGGLASYMVILSSVGFNTIIGYISTGQANQLKYILYEDYSAGILSLRYLAIHSCALAIFRRYKLKQKSKLDVINVLLLLSAVVISSRLSLVMMLFICLILFVTHSSRIKIKPVKVTVAGVILFVLLSALSYSRNKGFYEAKGHGFWSAGISEIVTYLGTPFQGAVAVGNNSELITREPLDWARYAYIEESLSTNSAFLQLFQFYGWYAFLIMLFTVAVFSYVAGFLKKQRNNYLYLSVLTILYAFAEFWRLYWFGTGIMITLVVFPVLVIFITVFLSKSAWRNMKLQ